MARYIDADALAEKKFQEPECKGFGEGVAYRCGWNDAIDAITDNEPTADVQPVRHGHWIGYAGTIGNECSICHTWLDVMQGTAEMNFCPNCGARMDGQ